MPGASALQKTTPLKPPMRDSEGNRLDSLLPRRDLPSVLGHYDFSTLAGAAGSAVALAPDLSGRGNHLAQTVSGSRPTIAVNGAGTKYLAFGASGYLIRSTVANGDWLQPAVANGYPQPITLIAVARAAAVAPTGTHRYLFGGTNADCTIALDGTLANFAVRGGSGSINQGPQFNDGQWHIFAGILSPYGCALYVDGYLVGGKTTQAQGTDALAGLVIGANATGAFPWNGDVAEAIVCNAQLTPAQINAVTKYLGAKW